jgi:hypothetical protein
MNTTGVQTLALTTPVTLGPGTFLFAVTGNATTLKIVCNAAGASGIYVYDTSTTGSSGALPGTITLTNTTPQSAALPVAAQWATAGAIPIFLLT